MALPQACGFLARAGCLASFPLATSAPQGTESLGQLGLIKDDKGVGRGEVLSSAKNHSLRRCDYKSDDPMRATLYHFVVWRDNIYEQSAEFHQVQR